jgi:hypothetical protein
MATTMLPQSHQMLGRSPPRQTQVRWLLQRRQNQGLHTASMAHSRKCNRLQTHRTQPAMSGETI